MRSATPARRPVLAAVLVSALLLSLPGLGAPGAPAGAETPAATVPFALVSDRSVDDRLAQPEDRYALASGCYRLQGADGAWMSRDGAAVGTTPDASKAVALHLQATRLGRYLLATNEGPDTSVEGAWWDVRGYVTASRPLLGVPAGAGVGVGAGATIASAPSEEADWEVVAAGDDPERRVTDGGGQAYTVRLPTDGPLAPAAVLGDYTFHHVPDDDPSDDDPNGTACADWPEVDVNAEGRPTPNPAGPAAEVSGFFESHVHGMAFEFLGGKARCGRPWHPWGVEFALVDCDDHAPGGRGAALEFVVSGGDPITGHDTVGWPTFGYWPRPDSLTHEQYYWRWLERAYLGGLRLSVNLLVDNTALCELYPQKRNSCNEMDGVRLQARRLFELQDYIDAQSGGPGEGWLRIVTDPTQAREVINAGRLAVVMGIEVSVLFDCGEYLDVPQCTADDIDARLAEVHDMGVRQMELINKFDNALSGVTGDGGTTGLVVNGGNRYVTGHFWDMRSCPEEHPHEHDKTQMNVSDDVPDGGRDEIDVLAGAIIGAFGPTGGAVAPAYPAGPHCNSRGLTDLGRHLIERMVERGMIVDPDHMSAAAMREALDHVEQVLIPAEQAAAEAEHRPAVQPALISSHSWGNDEVYQRIYTLDGMIGPRTAAADRFVDSWIERRDWAEALAPDGHVFGIGYGADTNGLGGQPGARRDPAVPLDYDGGFMAPIGGVRLHQQVSGVRRYDVGVDGVAHYGLFADWYREVALAADEAHPGRGGGAAITADMLRGSEAYLQTWERAVFGGGECVADQSAPHVQDLHALVGGNVEGFLEAVGQPLSRDGAAYTYCAVGVDGALRPVTVAFDAEGVALGVDGDDGVPAPLPVDLGATRLPVHGH